MCAIGACAALVVGIVAAPAPEAARQPERVKLPDVPWLSREASAQLVGDDGEPGPVFEHAIVGGSAPSPEVRERIAAFARANHISIALDIADGMLAAIRIEVTYGGCCGYEGADVLALRLHRPHLGGGCTCPVDQVLPNDWAFTTADRVHGRVRARAGTIGVRWEAALSLPDLLERADALLGQRASDVREAERPRWIEIEPGRRYLLEQPYDFGTIAGYCWPPPLGGRDDLGFQVATEHGRITDVSFVIGDEADPSALDARWGAPHTMVRDTGESTWWLRDRVVTAEYGWHGRVTIAQRARR